MSEDRKYFKVGAEGFAEKAIVAFKLMHTNTNTKWFEFAKKFGATELFTSHYVMGVMLNEDEVPEGWNSPKKLPDGCYKPQRRNICMDDWNQFNMLGCKPTGLKLAELLGIQPVFKSGSLAFPVFEEVNGETILSLHTDSETPEGLIELKMSEYWALKETG